MYVATIYNEPAGQTANLRKDARESRSVNVRTQAQASPWCIAMTAEKHHHKDRWSRAAKWQNKYLSCFLLPLQIVSLWQEFTRNKLNPDYLNCAQTDLKAISWIPGGDIQNLQPLTQTSFHVRHSYLCFTVLGLKI